MSFEFFLDLFKINLIKMNFFDFFKKKKETKIESNIKDSSTKIDNSITTTTTTTNTDEKSNNNSKQNSVPKQNTSNDNNTNSEKDSTNINNNETNYSKFSSNVVEVNVVNINKEKVGGYYYRKYIDKLEKMQPSSPILVAGAQNKIAFDEETVECFVDDLSTIYKKTIEPIENNEENVSTEFKFTNELLKLMNMIYSDNNFFNHLKSQEQENLLMNEIDSLDKMVDYLGENLNVLTKEFDDIEKKIFQN